MHKGPYPLVGGLLLLIILFIEYFISKKKASPIWKGFLVVFSWFLSK